MNVYSTDDYMAYKLYYNDKEFDQPEGQDSGYVIVIEGFVKYKNDAEFRKYYTKLRKKKLQKIIENNK